MARKAGGCTTWESASGTVILEHFRGWAAPVWKDQQGNAIRRQSDACSSLPLKPAAHKLQPKSRSTIPVAVPVAVALIDPPV